MSPIGTQPTFDGQAKAMLSVFQTINRSIDQVGRENTLKIIHELFIKIECISMCTFEEFKQHQYTIQTPTVEKAENLFKEYFDELTPA